MSKEHEIELQKLSLINEREVNAFQKRQKAAVQAAKQHSESLKKCNEKVAKLSTARKVETILAV